MFCSHWFCLSDLKVARIKKMFQCVWFLYAERTQCTFTHESASVWQSWAWVEIVIMHHFLLSIVCASTFSFSNCLYLELTTGLVLSKNQRKILTAGSYLSDSEVDPAEVPRNPTHGLRRNRMISFLAVYFLGAFNEHVLQGQPEGVQISKTVFWSHYGNLLLDETEKVRISQLAADKSKSSCQLRMPRNPNSEKLKNDLLRHEGALELFKSQLWIYLNLCGAIQLATLSKTQ